MEPPVKNLGDEYIEKYARVRKKSWREDKRILEKEVVPEWGRRKAKDSRQLFIYFIKQMGKEGIDPFSLIRDCGDARAGGWIFQFAMPTRNAGDLPEISIPPNFNFIKYWEL